MYFSEASFLTTGIRWQKNTAEMVVFFCSIFSLKLKEKSRKTIGVSNKFVPFILQQVCERNGTNLLDNKIRRAYFALLPNFTYMYMCAQA